MFKTFLDNLKVNQDSADQISNRYDEITKKLNQKFRDSDSKTNNCLQVGSYGRWTGIKGISDLDMIYIMPKNKWDTYKNDQSKLLTDVKNTIKERYPNTPVAVDKLVVTVTFTNFHVEVQPVFEEFDDQGKHDHYKFPITYYGGSWGKTKPRQEISAIKELNEKKNKNLRALCKMVRAWKNKHGICMGGLLIDTLAYNFLNSTNEYDNKSFLYFDYMSRDFFEFLANEDDHEFYRAPGSNQNVNVTSKFQRKARTAYDLCIAAINAENSDSVNDKWKKVYGRPFPVSTQTTDNMLTENFTYNRYNKTEEFIEDLYQIDIRYPIDLDCDISQNGFREDSLLNMLRKKLPLKSNKKLLFKADTSQIAEPFKLKWKVLNRGSEAIKRNCIRGQIFDDAGRHEQTEHTNFRGEHEVECYAINEEGYVIARASIDVPIAER